MILSSSDPAVQSDSAENSNQIPRRGFVQLPHEVTASPNLTDADVRVFAALMSFAMGRGECWPSLRTIGEACGGKGPKAVRLALQNLTHHRLIRVVEDPTLPTGRRYVLTTSGPEVVPAVAPRAKSPRQRKREDWAEWKAKKTAECTAQDTPSPAMEGGVPCRGAEVYVPIPCVEGKATKSSLTPAHTQGDQEGEARSANSLGLEESGVEPANPQPTPAELPPGSIERLATLAGELTWLAGLTDQDEVVAAMIAVYGPTDTHGSMSFYRKVVGEVATGSLQASDFQAAVARSIEGSAKRPGAVFANALAAPRKKAEMEALWRATRGIEDEDEPAECSP